jgi:hypothetical protein
MLLLLQANANSSKGFNEMSQCFTPKLNASNYVICRINEHETSVGLVRFDLLQ